MEIATHVLHRLTSYEQGRDWDVPHDDPRIVQGFVGTDLSRLPRPHKDYDGVRRALPREWPTPPYPAMAVLAGTAAASRTDITLESLARLLYLCAGITRSIEREGRTIYFRAAGSAGGRFPQELYLAVPTGGPLPAGVHWYDPSAHALVQIGPPPTGGVAALVVTSVPWRSAWRYAERAFRHIYWDAGTMLSQLLAAADSAGVPTALYTRFPDARVAALVGADGVREFPVAVVALDDGPPAMTASGAPEAGRYDADASEFPLITAAQRAGELGDLGRPLDRGDPVATTSSSATAPLDEVVLRRGSARLLDRARAVPRACLVDCLAVALRGIDVPHWVAVHAVDDTEPGLYVWPDLGAPVRPGDLRLELYHAGLDQGLPRDASFVVLSAVDLAVVDDRAYRDVQLRAGLVEGRLHLAAYALGAAASGMTFQDDRIPAVLGADLAGLLWTCIGVPEYRSRPGGRPGSPVRITGSVRPRYDDEPS